MAYAGWHIGPENAAERILIGNMEKEGLLMGETEKRYLETAIADDDIVYGATQIFDALSDFTRFQILCALSMAATNYEHEEAMKCKCGCDHHNH